MSSSNSICAVFAVLFLSVGLSAQNILNVPAQYPTIQAAYVAAANGDKILVAAGTFVGNVALGQKPIILEGAGPNLTTIQGVGGIAVSGSSVPSYTIVRNLRITGGTISGIYFGDSNGTFENCLIEGNSSNFNGGGVRTSNGGITLIDCVIRQNSSLTAGGGVAGSVLLLGCTVEANTAPVGAGVYAEYMAMIDCLIVNNVGALSAIAIEGPYSYLENCTIVGNLGSIDNAAAPSDLVDAFNCIVWGNTPPTPIGYDFEYSNVQGIGGGSDGNIDTDPMFVNPATGNYTLLPTSPCKNAGSPLLAPNPDGSIVDMGEIIGHLHLGGAATGNVGLTPLYIINGYRMLSVNGLLADNGTKREVVNVGAPFTISVTDPSSPALTTGDPFALAMSFGFPSLADTTFLPGMGEIVFSPNSTTLLIVDGFGSPSLAGPAFVPWSLTITSPIPVVGVLQGLCWRGGIFPKLCVTNAILLQIK